jgi:hypothetical protein
MDTFIVNGRPIVDKFPPELLCDLEKIGTIAKLTQGKLKGFRLTYLPTKSKTDVAITLANHKLQIIRSTEHLNARGKSYINIHELGGS